MANNGKTQTETSITSSGRAIGLPKAIEYLRQKVRTNPLATVGYSKSCVRVDALKPHLNTTTLLGELNGIGKEVPNNLLDARCVTRNGAYAWTVKIGQMNRLSIRCGSDHANRAFNGGRDIDGPDIEMKLPGDNSRNIEQIVDELCLNFGISFNGSQALFEDGFIRW